MTLKGITSEKIMGKVENAGKENEFMFPQCLLLFPK